MHLSRFFASAFSLALIAGIAAPALAHSLQFVEGDLSKNERYLQLMNEPAPKFTLEDAYGNKVSLDDFKGKVVVLNFIYARCKEECPLQSALIASIQKQVNQTPMREQVQFVTIATDTEDPGATAAVMRSYGNIHGLNSGNWVFLHGGSAQPGLGIAFARAYGLEFVPTDSGEQMHGVVTFLIDQNGMLKARYHGLRFDPVSLIVHAGALLHGQHGEPAGDPAAISTQPAEVTRAQAMGPMTWIWATIGLVSLGVLVFAAISLYRTLKTE
jgi:protein SCO1